jgi:hypothetical protein
MVHARVRLGVKTGTVARAGPVKMEIETMEASALTPDYLRSLSFLVTAV